MAIPETMRAMVLDGPRKPLRATELPVPEPGPGQVLLKVLACGVCRTDLHLLDGEVDVPEPPRVLGHQIVGELVAGELPEGASPGGLLGVPWLGWTDGVCEYCRSGRENLCPNAAGTSTADTPSTHWPTPVSPFPSPPPSNPSMSRRCSAPA